MPATSRSSTLERSGRLDTLVTQNIDGLHAEAGNDPARIVEIHGSSREAVCLRCDDRRGIDSVLERVAGGEDVPTCDVLVDGARCDGILKSAVISFGQSLVRADLVRAEDAARRCDVLLAVGTTLSVWPVAGMVPTAHSSGAAVVVVNGGPPRWMSSPAVRVDGAIEDVLPRIVAELAPV